MKIVETYFENRCHAICTEVIEHYINEKNRLPSMQEMTERFRQEPEFETVEIPENESGISETG